VTALERHPGPLAPAWVELLAPVAELARTIADTEFVPDSLRRRPAAIAACVMYGAELGVGPMAALAKIAIVKGRPAPSAELGRGLVIAAGHSVWLQEATTTRATMCGQRRGEERVHSVTWTMDDARRANLAGSASWRAYPRQMLVARASTELIRQAFPDVLGGITVFAEELDDTTGDVAPLRAVTDDTTPTPTTRRRRATPADTTPQPTIAPVPTEPASTSAIEVDLDGPIPQLPLPPLEEPDTTVSPAQTRALHAALRDAELTERADRLAFAAAAVGHPVTSSKDLTRDEVSTVIDAAKDLAAGRLGIVIKTDGWELHRQDDET
jgi:hypothetical protein